MNNKKKNQAYKTKQQQQQRSKQNRKMPTQMQKYIKELNNVIKKFSQAQS